MPPHWTRLDPRLALLLERFGACLCSDEPVWDGATWLHITASARVWNEARTHVLEVWSAKNGRFQLPQAHGEGDLDLPSLAAREARRALGWQGEQSLEGGEATELQCEWVGKYWNTPAHEHLEIVFEFWVGERVPLPRGARWHLVLG